MKAVKGMYIVFPNFHIHFCIFINNILTAKGSSYDINIIAINSITFCHLGFLLRFPGPTVEIQIQRLYAKPLQVYGNEYHNQCWDDLPCAHKVNPNVRVNF